MFIFHFVTLQMDFIFGNFFSFFTKSQKAIINLASTLKTETKKKKKDNYKMQHRSAFGISYYMNDISKF